MTCSDANLNQRLRDLRNFGIRSEEEVISPGINAKMNEFQAAFGLLNLKKVKDTIEKRKKLFERYHHHFINLPGLRFQRITQGTFYNYAYLTVEILPEQFELSRDDVYICMRKEGIMVRKYFYPLCSNYPCYQALPSARKDLLPHANRLASRILSLPLYSDMTEEDIDKIMEVFTLLHKHSKEIKNKISFIG